MPRSTYTSGFRRADIFHKPLRRVPGHGPLPARVILIGEKPGLDEARRQCRCERSPEVHGVPFIGASGQILDNYLEVANVPRSTVFVTNCVREFTEWTKPSRKELLRDKPELVEEILACNPEVVGLVGAYAVEWVLGKDKADLERTHGVPVRVPALFGGELPRDGDWLCIPLYHPANVIHAPDMAPAVLDDYLRLVMLLDGEIAPVENRITKPEYRLLTDPSRLLDIVDGHDSIAVDTEVSGGGGTWSVQFSCYRGSGYMIRNDGTPSATKLFGTLKTWLANSRPLVILHNALYDLSKLRQVGIDLVAMELPFIDTMIWAYQLCVEPQSLKSLAYRHAGMEMQEYDEIIGNAGYDIAMDYLYRVTEREWPDLEAEIMYEGNGVRVKKPQGVNKLVAKILADVASGKTNKKGQEVSPRKRWKQLSAAAKSPVIAVLGEMREPDLSDIPFERACHYACQDADATLRAFPVLQQKITAMDLERTSAMDHAIIPMIDRMQMIGIKLAPVKFWDDLEARCFRQMDKAKYEIYRLTGRDLNPASGDQMADLFY